VQQQRCEQRTLLDAAQPQRLTAIAYFQRTEQLEIHRGTTSSSGP
jgi:hypothetical protein